MTRAEKDNAGAVKTGGVARLLLYAVPFVLLLAAYYPLFAGFNFLPFSYYPNWGTWVAGSNGSEYVKDELFERFVETSFGSRENDQSGISIFYPTHKFAAESLRKGVLPLWDPYVGAGVPTFHEGQFRPFNVFMVPFYLYPAANTYCLSVLFGLAFGFLMMRMFLLGEGLSEAAAVFGSTIFVMNPFVLNRLSFPEHLFAYFFFPLLLHSVSRLRGMSLAAVAAASIPFVLMGHAGHPELCLIEAFLAGAYYLWTNRSPMREKIGVLCGIGLTTGLALLMYIAPLAQQYFISFSYKRTSFSQVSHLEWKALFAMFSDVFIFPAFFSFIAVALRRFRERKVAFFAVLFLLSLVYLMPLPLVGRVSSDLTVIDVPQFYSKFLVWFSAAFLCSLGLDDFTRNGKKLLPLAVFAVTAAATVIAVLRNPFSLFDYASGVVFALFILAGAQAVIFLWPKMTVPGAKKIGAMTVPSCLAVILLPLAFPLSWNLVPWNRDDLGADGGYASLKAGNEHERVVAPMVAPYCAFPPNSGSALKIRQLELNLFMFPNKFYENFGKYAPYPTFVTFDRPDIALFMKGGASLILLPVGAEGAGLSLRQKGNIFAAYSIPGARGRAFFADGVMTAGSGDDPRLVDIAALPEGTVLAEGIGVYPGNLVHSHASPVVFKEDGLHRVSLETSAEKGGFLVLRDTFHPDWKAKLDGKETTIYRVDGCFRGINVPAGSHSVEFVFRPILLYWAFLLSGIMHIALAWILFCGWRGKRTTPVEVGTPAGKSDS